MISTLISVLGKDTTDRLAQVHTPRYTMLAQQSIVLLQDMDHGDAKPPITLPYFKALLQSHLSHVPDTLPFLRFRLDDDTIRLRYAYPKNAKYIASIKVEEGITSDEMQVVPLKDFTDKAAEYMRGSHYALLSGFFAFFLRGEEDLYPIDYHVGSAGFYVKVVHPKTQTALTFMIDLDYLRRLKLDWEHHIHAIDTTPAAILDT